MTANHNTAQETTRAMNYAAHNQSVISKFKVMMRKPVQRGVFVLMLSAILSSCGGSVFTSKVKVVEEPEETSELTVEKIETDYFYSQYFSVWDSLLISSTPGLTDYNFHVTDMKNNREIGSFMRRGQGPSEHIGLTPISRIEKKGDDLVAFTYDPFKFQFLEWNITKSIETGRDSVRFLGNYTNPNDYGLTYAKIYELGESKYLGYTPATYFIVENLDPLMPTYWILEGEENAPTSGISILNDPDGNLTPFMSSGWSLSPDNSKIVDVMARLAQVNVIDLATNRVSSYRIAGSPGESTIADIEDPDRQFYDVACDNNSIYALYIGGAIAKYEENGGACWLYQFDWDGNFEKKYRLPVPLWGLWMDISSNTLYGYCEIEDAIYKLNV